MATTSTWLRNARALGGQPVFERRRRAAGYQVEQSSASGSVEHRSEVDDDGDVAVLAAAAGMRPAVLVDTNDPYPGQASGVGGHDPFSGSVETSRP